MSAPPFITIYPNAQKCEKCNELFVRNNERSFPRCSNGHYLCDRHVSSCGKCDYNHIRMIFLGNYHEMSFEQIHEEVKKLWMCRPGRDVINENGEYCFTYKGE